MYILLHMFIIITIIIPIFFFFKLNKLYFARTFILYLFLSFVYIKKENKGILYNKCTHIMNNNSQFRSHNLEITKAE